MFKQFVAKNPIRNEEYPSKERINAVRASVMSMLAQEDAMKHKTNDSIEFIENEKPVVLKKEKLSPWKKLIPAAAIAAAVAVATPVGINALNAKNAVGAASSKDISEAAANEIDLTSETEKNLSEDLRLVEAAEEKARMNVLKFNGEEYLITDDGTLSYDGTGYAAADYDKTFKAVGLKFIVDENGRITGLTEAAENPDIYYFRIDFSDKFTKFAYVEDMEGNIRVVIGDKVDELGYERNKRGIKYYNNGVISPYDHDGPYAYTVGLEYTEYENGESAWVMPVEVNDDDFIWCGDGYNYDGDPCVISLFYTVKSEVEELFRNEHINLGVSTRVIWFDEQSGEYKIKGFDSDEFTHYQAFVKDLCR